MGLVIFSQSENKMKNYFEDHTSRSIEELISLKGKGSVITGGADGIGAGIVKRFAEAGSSVVVADIDIKKAEETASVIAASTGSKVIACEVDVTDSESLSRAAEICLENFD